MSNENAVTNQIPDRLAAQSGDPDESPEKTEWITGGSIIRWIIAVLIVKYVFEYFGWL